MLPQAEFKQGIAMSQTIRLFIHERGADPIELEPELISVMRTTIRDLCVAARRKFPQGFRPSVVRLYLNGLRKDRDDFSRVVSPIVGLSFLVKEVKGQSDLLPLPEEWADTVIIEKKRKRRCRSK